MTKNPLINAVAATLYIAGISLVMSNGNKLFGTHDTFLTPIAVLSLFTLSAAVMAFVFAYQPLMLFLEGQKKRAVNLFLQTVGVFAAITVLIFVVMFLNIFK